MSQGDIPDALPPDALPAGPGAGEAPGQILNDIRQLLARIEVRLAGSPQLREETFYQTRGGMGDSEFRNAFNNLFRRQTVRGQGRAEITQGSETQRAAIEEQANALRDLQRLIEGIERWVRMAEQRATHAAEQFERFREGRGTPEQEENARRELHEALGDLARARHAAGQEIPQHQQQAAAAQQQLDLHRQLYGQAQQSERPQLQAMERRHRQQDARQLEDMLGFGSATAQRLGLGRANPGQTFSSAAKEGNIAGMLGSAANIAKNIPRAMAGDPTAIAALGKEAIELTVDHFKNIVRYTKEGVAEAGKALTSERAEDMGIHAFRSYQSFSKGFVEALGGPILGRFEAFLMEHNPLNKFAETVLQSIKFLRDFSDQLHQSNMRFAEFSASMAGVQIRQEMRDIYLSMERGNRRGESAEELAQGRHALNVKFAKVEDVASIIKNKVVGKIDMVLAGLFERSGLETFLDKALEWLGAGNENMDQFQERLWQNVGNNAWGQDFEQRIHEGRPRFMRNRGNQNLGGG